MARTVRTQSPALVLETDEATDAGAGSFDVVGAPTIVLFVSDEQPDESESAFRSLVTVGLAFSVAPADDQRIRAEWGGRVFSGSASVESLAASLRAFRDDLARLGGSAEDPRVKERAVARYQEQLDEARAQFRTIVGAKNP
jgi:hypothetical protein